MKKYVGHLLFAILATGMLGVPGYAQTVQYEKVCSLYGAAFHYLPGMDICQNEITGDSREQTEGGTWRSIWPYPDGQWVTNPAQQCASGRLVKVGSFKSTDFTLNAWSKGQTAATPVPVAANEFVSKVIMSGGFYKSQEVGARLGANGPDGLCIRSTDPTLVETTATGPMTLPFGDGMLPIGCVANSRIAGMPAAYAISATAAYPDIGYVGLSPTTVSGPYVYGKNLVVTTDLGHYLVSPIGLTYRDPAGNDVPWAGTVNAWVCIDKGSPQTSGNQNDH